jgi:hypothetical protein
MAPAHHARTRPTPQDHQPAGEPDEPLTHDHHRETKPLTLGPIGWSFWVEWAPTVRDGRGSAADCQPLSP